MLIENHRNIHALFLCMFLLFSFSVCEVDAARIIYTEGRVKVRFGDGKWQKAQVGMQLDAGDSVKTARHSMADISL